MANMPLIPDKLTANLSSVLKLIETKQPGYRLGRAYYTGDVKECTT
jgi:hypothetical protein